MNSNPSNKPTFWQTVRLLFGAARRRASGRFRRQQELLKNRGSGASSFGRLGFVMAVLFMAVLNCIAAFIVSAAVQSGERLDLERAGKVVVSHSFMADVESAPDPSPESIDLTVSREYSSESQNLAERWGGNPTLIEAKLRADVQGHGSRDLATVSGYVEGMKNLSVAGRFASMLGSAVLFWWLVMLICQGEGAELDLQRRRNPMWEWLFSHPVQPSAVFLAEVLAPIAANPAYWSAPLFIGIVYAFVYGPQLGLVAAALMGIPIALGTACVGKALEIGIILRVSPRSRGAIIGLMGWLGYASMILMIPAIMVLPKVLTAMRVIVAPLTAIPWPWLVLFLGGHPHGSFSFVVGMFTCWLFSIAMVAAGVWFSVWGQQRGLSGNFAYAGTSPSRPKTAGAKFGREPLYRKEYLWFIRDRSAIVQTILIPLTLAGYQAFNLRNFLGHADKAWNHLCGAAIIFGTYFLWVLGPKSLASEGTALWIALTWPRGLENLLKAKAWLWCLISSGLVALVLLIGVFMFPANYWQIALVGVGWFIFARSMAEKSVTLVTVPSESGEPGKISRGRQFAASLGMFTFAVGVLTRQWTIALSGIVYSYVTAAAMWENFRARLPYLYDQWSEKLPPPPTLMHAMVSISILVEAGSIAAGIAIAIVGQEAAGAALAISYGVCAVLVSIGVQRFLASRGVPLSAVINWGKSEAYPGREWQQRVFSLAGMGATAGLILGICGVGYLATLRHIPATAEMIRKSQEIMTNIPSLRIGYAVMAIAFAPFAEEFLFRGLLYRALDREWGGWRAVVGSAAFFAIYHPPLAWPMVFSVGAVNALLFKKTRSLAPAVALHMIYNLVVVST